MAAESDGLNRDTEVFPLQEFTECYTLPEWVDVVGGSDACSSQPDMCTIRNGTILMLRTLAVESVTLSFNDTDTGMKRIVQVSPDSQVKFKVLLPWPDFKNPKGPRTVYKTVSDLLKVCPIFFKANVCYDDPYLPAIVKSGEVFRFIRQIKRLDDRRVYLQCEDADGNIVELPDECRGDFTAVDDEKSYTLKEILELGPIDRKLKLSHDHIKMSLTSEAMNGTEPSEILYENLSHSGGSSMLQRIMGLPLTYSGLISFHRPVMFLAASPSDNVQDVWKVPIDLNVTVKRIKVDDYEKPKCRVGNSSEYSPVCKMFKLNELLNTFHDNFPVLATLVHYQYMPPEFIHCLEPGCDIIIHGVERFDRILAKSADMFFAIARDLSGRFRRTLKKVKSVEELKLLFSDRGEEVYVKVLQDIASDFPVPFSLQTGDMLRFKSFKTKMHKVKSKSKQTFGPFPVIHCEKRTENGAFEKMLMPEDLEVCLHEMPSQSKADGFSSDDVFRFKPELPLGVDYLPDYSCLWSCLPITAEILLTNFITEPFAIVSRQPKLEDETPEHVDPIIRDCLLVPARHHMMLTVKECLGFPPGYFQFPDRRVYISPPVEKIGRHAYDELIRNNDMAYEDYELNFIESPSGGDLRLPIRGRTTSQSREGAGSESVNRRLSRSLSNMFKNKGGQNLLNKGGQNLLNKLKKIKPGQKQDEGTMSVSNETYTTGSQTSHTGSHTGSTGDDDEQQYDDENIYEHVEIGLPSRGSTS